jgi:hypothetical protein
LKQPTRFDLLIDGRIDRAPRRIAQAMLLRADEVIE